MALKRGSGHENYWVGKTLKQQVRYCTTFCVDKDGDKVDGDDAGNGAIDGDNEEGGDHGGGANGARDPDEAAEQERHALEDPL